MESGRDNHNEFIMLRAHAREIHRLQITTGYGFCVRIVLIFGSMSSSVSSAFRLRGCIVNYCML